MHKATKKRTVDVYPKLDIADLASEIDFEVGTECVWVVPRDATGVVCQPHIRVRVKPDVGIHLTHEYKGQEVGPYLVPIVSTKPNYGGKRYWFLCPNPDCRRRIRILYAAKYFLCRHCLNLTYATTQTGSRLVSVQCRLRFLNDKLNGRGRLLEGPPPIPLHMHSHTYAKLYDEYNDLLRMRQELLSARVTKLVNSCTKSVAHGAVASLLQAPALHVEPQGFDYMATDATHPTNDARVNASLTLGELAKAADVPFALARDAKREQLLAPDLGRARRRKRYRPKLASWLCKLHVLISNGYSWTEIREWTARRFNPGHEHERKWPAGFSNAHGAARTIQVSRPD